MFTEMSDRERQILHVITDMWNLKKKTMDITNRNRFTYIED